MNSGDLKTYKCVQISKSNFFTITILSLHSICSESKKVDETRKKIMKWLSSETLWIKKNQNWIFLNYEYKNIFFLFEFWQVYLVFYLFAASGTCLPTYVKRFHQACEEDKDCESGYVCLVSGTMKSCQLEGRPRPTRGYSKLSISVFFRKMFIDRLQRRKIFNLILLYIHTQ